MSDTTRDGIDLDAIRARAEAATEGPWHVTYEGSRCIDASDGSVIVDSANDGIGAGVIEQADAEFIAHARTDVPALLAAVVERDAEIERLREDQEQIWDPLVTGIERERDEARAVLGAVAALADEWQRYHDDSHPYVHTIDYRDAASMLRRRLAPVSGAVEECVNYRAPQDCIKLLPNPDDWCGICRASRAVVGEASIDAAVEAGLYVWMLRTGWNADDVDREITANGHDVQTCRRVVKDAITAALPHLPARPAPVAGHEQEVRADGASLIAAERARQVAEEGWTAEHDSDHADDSLVRAALSYATPARERGSKSVARLPRASGRWSHVDQSDVPTQWPWAGVFWKPSPRDRTRELVKAGALIAAEIDRLAARSSGSSAPVQGGAE